MTTKLSTILNSHGGSGNITLITENRDPLASDTATLGTIWINESTNRYFICTDETAGNAKWEAGAGGEAVATDTRDPNSSDLGNIGSMWINTATNKFFICTDDTPTATVWDTDTQIDVILDTTDPTASNSGHPIGTMWINTTTYGLFFCMDGTSGNAVWKPQVNVVEAIIDPTPSDDEYSLGTIWINASTANQKTYFVLIDNTTDHAIWSKNETDVYWVTDPLITGSSVAECDHTLYAYNASGSLSAIDEATTLTYHWTLSAGVLSASTGASVNVYFTNAEKASTQILTCYATDDLGNTSKPVEFHINVRVVNPVDNLILSTPNKIYTNESSFFDITVGYGGGDPTLNYFWESSENNTTWTSAFFVNPNLKLGEAIITNAGDTYVRCTVTNLGGSVTESSSAIPTIDIVTDMDSTYLDTDLHELENKEYYGTFITPSVVSVPTIVFEQNDRIIVNGNQDDVANVLNVFDTQMNMITDEVLINDDYTSFSTTCTLMGNKVLVAYVDSQVSGKGVIRVGTFNGDSISFGEPIEFNNDYSQWIQLLPLVDNKVIISYRDDGNNNLGGCRIGTVTGDEITFSAEFVFNSVDTDHISMCKIDDARFAVAYSDYGTGNLGTLVVGQVTGDTITFGTQQVYTNSAFFNSVALIGTDKLAITYQDDTNSNYGTCIIAGVSGTSLVLGTPQVFSNLGYTNYIKVLALGTDKIAITYQDVGTSGHGYCIIGDVSATVVTFGVPVAFETSNTTYIDNGLANDKLYVAYQDSTNAGKVNFATITGTVPVFETASEFSADEADFISVYEFGDKMVLIYKDGGDADQGKVMIYTPYKQELTLASELVSTDTDITRLNTEYVLPIIGQQPSQDVFEKVEMRVQTLRDNIFDVTEDAGKIVFENYEIEPYVVGDRLLAVGDTDVHSVITQIDRSVVGGTGLSVSGNEDIFSEVNTQQTNSAMLGDFVVSAFRDNSAAGSVVLGEVKYDNVHWQTKLTFNANDVDYVSVTKLAEDKAIVAFQDLSDNSGKVMVVKIVDEELMLGGVFQFSGTATEHLDIAQLDTDKFIISYQDVGDLNKGKYIIGSVSDTTVSFGSSAEFSANNCTYTSVTAVSSTKVAIAYRDVDNAGAGTVNIGNVVGTAVTFGTNQIFYAGSTTYVDVEMLSASKIVISFTDYANSNYGSVIVGVVSGTNVAYGVSQYFNANETYYSNVVTVEDDVFMVVYDNYVGAKGYSRVGTVSGNAIAMNGAIEINNSTTSHIDAVMVNPNKIVATYSDQGNSYKGTSQIIRRDIDLLRAEIHINDTLPTNISTIELLPYRLEASAGEVQSFESTEYYDTDLDEIFSILNNDTLLTTATIMTSGNYFYSRLRATNTDELDKSITRIDVDFWTQP